MYDFVIVGGGPTGLTLATYLPGKVALVERHPVLGGCHRVLPAKQFAEHGPRVYSGSYASVRMVLRDIGVHWDDVFEHTPFSPELIDGRRWYQWLSPPELLRLTWDYLVFALFDADHGKRVSMKRYARKFSATARAHIDAVCRMSDGAGSDRYTLWEFLSGFDQHMRPFYVPKKPLDGLFRRWHEYLKNTRNVDVFLGTEVATIRPHGVTLKNKHVLRGAKVILAVPPTHVDDILEKSRLEEPGFREFAKKSKYEPYWSVSFFGATVDNAAGHKTTPWGVFAVQYPFGVISAAASVWNVASPVTGKTLKQSSSEEAVEEIRRQLGLPEGVTHAFVSGPYRDSAFVFTHKTAYWKPELRSGIASVGCHNGRSSYAFTSMESAVRNALSYLGKPAASSWDASEIGRWVLLVILLLFVLIN